MWASRVIPNHTPLIEPCAAIARDRRCPWKYEAGGGYHVCLHNARRPVALRFTDSIQFRTLFDQLVCDSP